MHSPLRRPICADTLVTKILHGLVRANAMRLSRNRGGGRRIAPRSDDFLFAGVPVGEEFLQADFGQRMAQDLTQHVERQRGDVRAQLRRLQDMQRIAQRGCPANLNSLGRAFPGNALGGFSASHTRAGAESSDLENGTADHH